MSYEVSILADSVSPAGARLTTFQLKYPRMVHAELLMHRTFSRSASSTRAIPVAKMIEWVMTDPAMPVYWGKNRPGMQATEALDPDRAEQASRQWLSARDLAVSMARDLMEIGVHKQLASRLLEPFAHINVVLTATSFENFFALRCHEDAMPELQVLAVKMARAYRASEPTPRPWGQSDNPDAWHLPYVTDDERSRFPALALRVFSTARCARVSYRTFEGKEPDPEADVVLHERLHCAGHWGPFEHQARPLGDHLEQSANFRGWLQYRVTLRECVHESFDYSILDRDYADRDFIV